MGDANNEEEAAKLRSDWMKSLLAEMEKLRAPCEELVQLDEDVPSWVAAVEKQFAFAMLPAAKLKKGVDITPRRFGAIFGHQCAMAVWMVDWLDSDEAQKFIASQPSSDPIEAADSDPDELVKWYRGMRRLAKKALCSSVDQTYETMSDFLCGFADAFRRKPNTFKASDLGSTAFEIHFFMLMFWREVASLSSVSQLHRVLVKLIGAPRVGDLKRVEKICQRVGLAYREPGRPKKSAVIQT